jgi:hypothetical protein
MKMLMRARCSGAAIIVLAPTAITVHAQKRNGMEDRFANIRGQVGCQVHSLPSLTSRYARNQQAEKDIARHPPGDVRASTRRERNRRERRA